jgi:tRNA(fMet)-specific endonuclease VapC
MPFSCSIPTRHFISVLSVGEVAEGFAPGQESDCWICLCHYTILDLDRDIAWAAGQFSRQLRGNGQAIGENDVWIASTALRHHLALVTNNAQHFLRVPGLQLMAY